MKKIGIDKKITYSLFLIFIIIVGLYTVYDKDANLYKSKLNNSCLIKYSYPKIINEKISIGFYNPSIYNMTNIKVMVPKFNGIDIYNVNKSLPPHEARVLTFFNYKGSIDNVNKFIISWCCDDKCYESKLNNFSSSIKITVNNFSIDYKNYSMTNSTNRNYPVHPKLHDCEKINNSIERQFCYSDVAEINNNATICQEFVYDHDINPFCLARITLNKTMCNEIKDLELKKTCIKSIEMKSK